MPRETVTIELSKLAPYEAAAQLFAVIAYPDSQKDRVRFSDAICGWMLGQLAEDPAWASAPHTTLPRYWKALVNGPDVELARGFHAINRERMVAAKMGAPRFEEYYQFATEGREPGWARQQRPTGETVISAVSVDLSEPRRRDPRGPKGESKSKGSGGDDRGNIIRRIWTPSRPVLHLCLALHRVIHVHSPAQQDLHLGDFWWGSHAATARIISDAVPIAIAMRPCFDIESEERIEVIAA